MASADLVLAGGTVWHSAGPGSGRPTPTHVAVTAGRIVALGGSEVADLVGPRTRVVDLAGGLLVPGFQDAHVHPVQGGRERLSCDLSDDSTRADYVRTVRDYASHRTDLDLGHRRRLDARGVPGRPAAPGGRSMPSYPTGR